MKLIISFISILVLSSCLLIKKAFISPKFKEGDCIEEENLLLKIVKVGQYSYSVIDLNRKKYILYFYLQDTASPIDCFYAFDKVK